ncbi:AP2/ERF family transcription factor [Paracoccus versutus]
MISIDDLREMIRLDSETGRLYWKERDICDFPSPFMGRRWNNRYASKEAFTAKKNGYACGTIHGRSYQAHRVVFAITHGRWPVDCVDHIDMDRSNNRPDNLREATKLSNAWNKKITKQNKSGFKGVSFHTDSGRWISSIWADKKNYFLGRFDTAEEAAIVYDSKARELHGEFAHLNFPDCPVLKVVAESVSENNRRYKRDRNVPRSITIQQQTTVRCPESHPVFVEGKGCRK